MRKVNLNFVSFKRIQSTVQAKFLIEKLELSTQF